MPSGETSRTLRGNVPLLWAENPPRAPQSSRGREGMVVQAVMPPTKLRTRKDRVKPLEWTDPHRYDSTEVTRPMTAAPNRQREAGHTVGVDEVRPFTAPFGDEQRGSRLSAIADGEDRIWSKGAARGTVETLVLSSPRSRTAVRCPTPHYNLHCAMCERQVHPLEDGPSSRGHGSLEDRPDADNLKVGARGAASLLGLGVHRCGVSFPPSITHAASTRRLPNPSPCLS